MRAEVVVVFLLPLALLQQFDGVLILLCVGLAGVGAAWGHEGLLMASAVRGYFLEEPGSFRGRQPKREDVF